MVIVDRSPDGPAPCPAGRGGTGAVPAPPIPVGALVDRILRIPEQYRVYAEDETAAVEIHKIPGSLLHELLDHGLAHRRAGDGRLLLDRLDLENIGLALHLPSPRYVAMRRWRGILAGPREPGHRDYRVSILGRCPDRGHPGPCEFTADPDLLAAARAAGSVTAANGRVIADVSIPVHAGAYGPEHLELFRCVEPLEFQLLPVSMPIDLGWSRETGLADCRVASRLLVTAAAERGLAARYADGLVMLPPFPMRHFWIEVVVDGGGWAVADPFWFQSLARWGIVDAGRYPVRTSPAGLLWKLYESNPLISLPLMRHGDRAANYLLNVAHAQSAAGQNR